VVFDHPFKVSPAAQLDHQPNATAVCIPANTPEGR
jgi:hypothetical protein